MFKRYLKIGGDLIDHTKVISIDVVGDIVHIHLDDGRRFEMNRQDYWVVDMTVRECV